MIKINLLPPKQIEKIRLTILYQNVLSSLLIVFLMILFLTIILALVLIFLNLNYLNIEKKINAQQIQTIETESINSMQTKVKDLNDNLLKIKTIQDKRSHLYDVLDKVNEELFKSVKVYTLDISREKDVNLISVTGNAPLRENLVAIRNILNTDPHYKEVDFPLANLANPKNINFRFSFTYAP